MKTPKLYKKINKAQRLSALAIVLVGTLVGVYYLTGSHATGPYVSANPSGGNVVSPALKQTCTGANTNNCVEFGTAATSSAGGTGISLGSVYESAFDAMNASQRAAVVAQMKAANVTWIRVDIYPNYYTYANEWSGYGFKIIAILEDFPPSTTADMSSFATQAVDTLEPLGVQTYEILNEVNLYNGLSISAAEYVPYLKAAYMAIKAVDPGSTILNSGLGTLDDPGQPDYPVNYLQAEYAAGAKGYFDAMNMHPYSYPQLPDADSAYNMYYNLPNVYAVMQANGDGAKKIWLTEFGCPTGTDGGYPDECTDATLAESISEASSMDKGWSWGGPLLFFDWQDSTGAGDFGLYQINGSPKSDSLAAFTSAGE